MAFILKIRRRHFSQLYHCRIDIIHIVKTRKFSQILQAKYYTKYCNGILSDTWGHVREEAGLGVGVVVGKTWWGAEGIISFSVALDSFVTFSPNLSKFSGREGVSGSVR